MSKDKLENLCRYFLGRDQSSHWYLVLADYSEQWTMWTNIPEEDERCWIVPWYATRINGGPEFISFLDPVDLK